MDRAPDPEIIEEALRRGVAVVTRDNDFARLVALAGAVSPSVITARVSLPRAAAVELLRELVPAVAEELRHGALITVTTAGVRVRTLPVEG